MYYPLDLEGQTEVCMHGSFCDMDILLHISFPFFFFFFAPKNFSFNVFQSRKTESKDSKRGVKDVDPHKSFGANKDKEV